MTGGSFIPHPGMNEGESRERTESTDDAVEIPADYVQYCEKEQPTGS